MATDPAVAVGGPAGAGRPAAAHPPVPVGGPAGAVPPAAGGPPVRLLVVAPDASRTGAPVALLRLCRWLVAEGAVEPVFVLHGGGPLVEAFAALGPVHVHRARGARRLRRALGPRPGAAVFGLVSGVRDRRTAQVARAAGASVVLANTAVTATTAWRLRRRGLRVVSYVHELDDAVRRCCDAAGQRVLGVCADRFLAVSDPVRAMLVDRFGVPGAAVTLVAGTVADDGELSRDAVEAARRRLGAGPDDVVVGASGPLGWTKGSDLFLQAASRAVGCSGGAARLRFCWLGPGTPEEPAAAFLASARRLGLQDVVTLLPPVADPAPVLASFDVFVSSSREDANPLTVMEAALLERPVVCFAGAGGAASVAAAGGGVAVPAGRADLLGEAVAALSGDAARRRAMGRRGRQHVDRHHRAAAVGPAVVASIAGLAPHPSGRR